MTSTVSPADLSSADLSVVPSAADAGRRPLRRALLSVSDKAGIEELARELSDAGVELVSTGATAARLRGAGLEVTAVEEVTGFPEMLDGRVKTLHPRVHGGLLADPAKPEHAAALQEQGIEAFDLLVVNLYPFSATVASGAAPEECIEQIDIGGPAMIRAAAKNNAAVAVVVDRGQYPLLREALAAGGFTAQQRRTLAAAAFAHTASYDVAVASYLGNVVAPPTDGSTLPQWLGGAWHRRDVLRYGENPHQAAALYASANPAAGGGGLVGAEQLQGKAMSYNNFVDADAAQRAAYDFDQPCVAIIKHNNPCGLAVGTDATDAIADAHRKAHACDPLSAFGGVIAANRAVTETMARQIADVFTEVVVAPDFAPEALEILGAKKNVRVLRSDAPRRGGAEVRLISGGVLLQERDALDAPGDDPSSWQLLAGPQAPGDVLADLAFAWRASRSVKSNAIVLAAEGATVGVGMGQVNRVDSARLAVSRAGDRARGSVGASDGFFPFPDGLEVLLEAGVRAVVQPGGSVRDADVAAAAERAGVPLYVTGTRHFAH